MASCVIDMHVDSSDRHDCTSRRIDKKNKTYIALCGHSEPRHAFSIVTFNLFNPAMCIDDRRRRCNQEMRKEYLESPRHVRPVYLSTTVSSIRMMIIMFRVNQKLMTYDKKDLYKLQVGCWLGSLGWTGIVYPDGLRFLARENWPQQRIGPASAQELPSFRGSHAFDFTVPPKGCSK